MYCFFSDVYGSEWYPDERIRSAFTEWFKEAHEVCPDIIKEVPALHA